MANEKPDYEIDHLIQFLKEEFDRIINLYPRQSRGTLLNEAQAFGVWFLDQEVGISYDEANKCVLDESRDCGVDFIWHDDENEQVIIGQVEYDASSWSRNPADAKKAISTFGLFQTYLSDGHALPAELHEAAQPVWRQAKHSVSQKHYSVRYIFVTPKHLSKPQREKIRGKSKINDYDFFTYEELLEIGHEFLDGKT